MGNGLRSTKGIASPPYTDGPYEWDEVCVLNKPAIEGSDRYVVTEEYAQRPMLNASIGVAANLNFEILGTNAAEADVTWGTTVGGLELKTAGADNDQVIVLPHLDTLQTAWSSVLWGTENQTQWEAVIKTDSAVTTVLLWLGLKLTNTPVIATDADQAFFRFSTDDGDTTFHCVSSIGGVDTNTSTSVTVAVSTIYYLRIEIDKDRKAHFFINNKEVSTTAALTDNIDLIPYVGVQALSAAASHLYLSKQKISRYVYE